MRDDESYQNRLLGGEVMGREQKTMKGRAKSAGSEAMVQSINRSSSGLALGIVISGNWPGTSADLKFRLVLKQAMSNR